MQDASVTVFNRVITNLEVLLDKADGLKTRCAKLRDVLG